MKKTLAALLAVLTLLFTAACGPQSAGPLPTVPGGQLLPGAGAARPEAPQNTETALSLLAPGDETALGDTLAALAAADGNRLSVQRLVAGPSYMENLAQALAGENAPDLFWVPDEDSLWAAVGLDFCADLSGGGSAAMRALAGQVPQNSFLAPDGGAYGLPAGYTAQGNLVNLALLAVLLGTQNLPQLRGDLAACTATQWGNMVSALDTYLQRPGVMQIRLGENTYTTPGYRPRQAQRLRGIYAIGTESAHMFAQTAVSTAYAAAFASWQEAAELDSLDKARRLVEALASMGGLFDIESYFMTGPNGPLRRGEDFLAQEGLSDREAAALFTGGTALVMRAGLQTALALQAEHPQLAGQLALVPLKFPAPPEEADAANTGEPALPDDATDGDTGGENLPADDGSAAGGETAGTDGSGGDTSDANGIESDSSGDDASDASQTADETGGDAPPPRNLAAAIEANNSLLLYDISGYLCVNANSPNQDAAFSLLLRLYTTEAGRAAYLQATGRPLFGAPAYPDLLVNDVCLAFAGNGGLRAVASGASLAGGEAQIAAIVREQLLPVSEWDTDIETGFLIACLQALGFNWEM